MDLIFFVDFDYLALYNPTKSIRGYWAAILGLGVR
jgi:hypothetical protein